MNEIAIGTIMLFATLAILMVIRIPIAFSLAISALVTATYLGIPYFNQKEGLIPRSLLRNKLFQDMEEVIY